jgi:hypothetical protein
MKRFQKEEHLHYEILLSIFRESITAKWVDPFFSFQVVLTSRKLGKESSSYVFQRWFSVEYSRGMNQWNWREQKSIWETDKRVDDGEVKIEVKGMISCLWIKHIHFHLMSFPSFHQLCYAQERYVSRKSMAASLLLSLPNHNRVTLLSFQIVFPCLRGILSLSPCLKGISSEIEWILLNGERRIWGTV